MNYKSQGMIFLIFSCFLLLFSSCAQTSGARKSNVIKVPAGSNIPQLGLAMDASYDRNLDGVIPDHKILTVAITNNSIDIISMNPNGDKWWVYDIRDRRHEAIIDLRSSAPNTYVELPERLRRLLEYPLILQVGETRTIDLLFNKDVDLDGFRSVKFVSSVLGRTFEIIARE